MRNMKWMNSMSTMRMRPMSHSPQHRRQKHKNWMLFAILLGFSAIFFALTIIKIGQNT